jgi:hypothetical protein
MSNPALEKNPPKAIDFAFYTAMDDINGVPVLGGVGIELCYQVVNGKALVYRGEIETEPAQIGENWNAYGEIIESEIAENLMKEKQLEVIFK